MDIVNGKREEIIKGTPVEYSDIYTGNKFYVSRMMSDLYDD
jgi:hypothetical protein